MADTSILLNPITSTEHTNGSTVVPPTMQENLCKAEETLRNIIECFRLQVLANVDEVAASLQKELGTGVDREKIQRIKFLLDHMLKSPMQRQLNRIKSVADAFADFLPKTEKSRS